MEPGPRSEVGTKDTRRRQHRNPVRPFLIYARGAGGRGGGEKSRGRTRTLCIRIHASNPPFIGDSATLKRSSPTSAQLFLPFLDTQKNTAGKRSRGLGCERDRQIERERERESESEGKRRALFGKGTRNGLYAASLKPAVRGYMAVFSGGLYDRLRGIWGSDKKMRAPPCACLVCHRPRRDLRLTVKSST